MKIELGAVPQYMAMYLDAMYHRQAWRMPAECPETMATLNSGFLWSSSAIYALISSA
jgi:hypothetical protein